MKEKIGKETVGETGRLDTKAGGFISKSDYAKIKNRPIVYNGPGLYSMDDFKTYRKGTFATYSRILMK